MYKNSDTEQSTNAALEGSNFSARLLTALPSLNAFSIALCGDRDTAKDLVQETVLKALEKSELFRSDREILPWLITILRNTFFSQRRKYGREISYSADVHENSLMVAPAQLARVEVREFERAVQQLPAEQRETLLLIVVQGFSYEETAKACGCLVGTVKSRLNRARLRLAATMQGGDRAAVPQT